jgi:hypothetical protein
VRSAKCSKKGCSLFFWIRPVASGWPMALNFSRSWAWAAGSAKATARAAAARVVKQGWSFMGGVLVVSVKAVEREEVDQ